MSDGVVKQAARETGVPEQTVRNWKKKWETDGPPATVQDIAVNELAPEFVELAVSVRDQALERLAVLLPQTTVKDLNALSKIVGILDDKVRLAKGLATSRKEVTTKNVMDPEQMREFAATFVQEAISQAHQRAEEIIDAEEVEQVILTLDSPLDTEE